MISNGQTRLIKVHSEASESADSEVTYYATKKCLDQFVKKVLVKVPNSSQKKQIEIEVEETMTEDVNEEVVTDVEDSENSEIEMDISVEAKESLEKSSSTSSKKYSCG